MKHATAGLAVALVTVVLATILATAQSQATLSGRVVADATGDPIPNARIAVTPPVPGTPVVLSDGNGRFSISIPAGQAKVVATALSGIQPIPLQPGDERSGVDFVVPVDLRILMPPVIVARLLQQGAPPPRDPAATAIVRGRVTSADGRAVPHARVRLLGHTDIMQTQDARRRGRTIRVRRRREGHVQRRRAQGRLRNDRRVRTTVRSRRRRNPRAH